MNQRTLLDRLLSPAGFGLVLLLFLLPMATVSCSSGGESIDASFTGLDFVIGGEPTISGANVDPDIGTELAATFIDFYDAEPLAIIAVVLLLVGMAVGLVRQRQLRATISAAIAAVTLVLLGISLFVRFPAKVNDAIDWFKAEAQMEDPIAVSTRPTVVGWIALVLLLALAVWQGYEAIRSRTPEPVGGPPPPGTEPPPAGAPALDPALDSAEAQQSWRAPEAS